MKESSIDEIQELIIDDFSFFESWDEKYTYIIDLGKQLPPITPINKTDINKVKGCQSQVWLHAYKNDDKIFYEADSDAIIVKGLIALLLQIFSSQKAIDIVQSELYFINKIGMHQHLSPTRSNGLSAMVKQIKFYALALQ